MTSGRVGYARPLSILSARAGGDCSGCLSAITYAAQYIGIITLSILLTPVCIFALGLPVALACAAALLVAGVAWGVVEALANTIATLIEAHRAVR